MQEEMLFDNKNISHLAAEPGLSHPFFGNEAGAHGKSAPF